MLLLTDIFPTGYQAAVNVEVCPGDTVAIWGAGPVGLFCLESCKLLGAERVFLIDDVLERLAIATARGAEVIDRSEVKPYDALMEATHGLLPGKVIDAVGMEAHGSDILDTLYDRVKTATMQETGRPHVVREAILSCSKGASSRSPGSMPPSSTSSPSARPSPRR